MVFLKGFVKVDLVERMGGMMSYLKATSNVENTLEGFKMVDDLMEASRSTSGKRSYELQIKACELSDKLKKYDKFKYIYEGYKMYMKE